MITVGRNVVFGTNCGVMPVFGPIGETLSCQAANQERRVDEKLKD